MVSIQLPRSKRALGNSTLICNTFIIPQGGFRMILFLLLLWTVITLFLTIVLKPPETISYVVTILFGFVTTIFGLCTAYMDPGIIIPLSSPPTSEVQVVEYMGEEISCPICPTCNIYRIPRSSHCSICDYCVEFYDHHCSILGCCIALRTFRFFTGFLFFSLPVTGYITVRIALIFISLFQENLSESKSATRIVSLSGIFAISLLGLTYACRFFLYALWLAFTNRTTKDFIKMRSSQNPSECYCCQCPTNPYPSKGCWNNLFTRLFSPIPISKITSDIWVEQ